jgi:signal transduction histidine kinase/DNA-binding response OmpR family regulator
MKYSEILYLLPIGVIEIDKNNQCTYVNKYIKTHFSADNIKEYINANCDPEDNDNNIPFKDNFYSTLSESTSAFKIKNNTENYNWYKKFSIVLNIDEQTQLLYIIQDINDSKNLEIELREEKGKVEKAYNHKSTFLANMSHEIRTPLNGIIGMLTLLEDTSLNTDQQDYINMVKECSYNLMTIINDILDFSKLEVGKITLDIKTLNLQECVESTNDIILSKIYEKALEYTYNIHPEIPTFIIGDHNRIKQVLLNVISNAVKFTEKGTIFLNVEKIKADEFNFLQNLHGNSSFEVSNDSKEIFLRFDVTDTGCGIEDKSKSKLFKSFTQLDNIITSKIYPGTGLGLVISKQLVELMGGCIWLDWSEPLKGSRFSFIIRARISDEQENLQESDNDTVLVGANCLIVDDNLYNRISLTGMITKWGMKAHAFSNGEEALYFTRLTKFDIGLIDICMPKIDGPTFAVKLREQKEFENKNFPLIALSSLGDKLTSTSTLFKNHLVKPIKEAKLKQICIENLRQHKKMSTIETVIQESSNNVNSYMKENEISSLKDNIRILLAEDVYVNQRVIVSFLNKIGYTNVTVVENGKQCLDLTTNQDFDIILLDIRMPVMDGDVVLKHLREYFNVHKDKRMPYTVAVTAYCLREDKDKYLSLGFDDYIPKPVSIAELTKCFNSFIESLLQN